MEGECTGEDHYDCIEPCRADMRRTEKERDKCMVAYNNPEAYMSPQVTSTSKRQ